MGLVLISGCVNYDKPVDDIDERYLDDPLYCESDDDCAYQETACNGCGCPDPINKYNKKALACAPSGYQCDLYCEPKIPKCENNQCILVKDTIRENITNENITSTNPPPEPTSYNNLAEYYASRDYSCNLDSDCEIKDVHNCCGYYPECVNKNFETNPEYVRKSCDLQTGGGSACGYLTISSCQCIQNKCKRVSPDGSLSSE